MDFLALFGIGDGKIGAAFDQGAFEGAVACQDQTVSSQMVTGTETYIACGTLILEPAFEVTATGDVEACAGERVVWTSGFSAAEGASFKAGTGVLPD